MPILVLVHISGAVIGLLAGYTAMLARKGSGLHGASGTIFFVSMLVMSGSAAYVAAFMKPEPLNVVVGLLMFYLVSTAWWAAKRRDGRITAFDVIALLWIIAVGTAGVALGFQGARSATGTKDGVPVAVYFIFGSIALLCGLSDLRMVARGGVADARRIRRHLWRMCLALLIATLSLFPGQLRQFPAAWHHTTLIYMPHIFLVGSMIFWMVRYSARRRARQEATT